MTQLKSRLLVVTDRQQTNGRPLLSVLERVIKAGAPAIQLRERDLSSRDLLQFAKEIEALTSSVRSPFLINDRIDIALMLKDAGVHLRSDSLPPSVARCLLPVPRLLGISAHSVEETVRAESDGADYVVLGPIYATPSKQQFGPPLGLRRMEEACGKVRIPVIGIGGVTAARVPELRRAGAYGVAVITAILSAVEIERATCELLDAVSLSF